MFSIPSVDSQLVMDELAADRNKNADDKAVARALVKQLQKSCTALKAENAELRAKLAGQEAGTDG